MSGDISRDTFKKIKHYDSVRMQQGRVLTDADWNEQDDINKHIHETGTGDIIGCCGAPEIGGGFRIDVIDKTNGDTGHHLAISPGRIYTDGTLCELEATELDIIAFAYDPANPDTPNGAFLELPTLTVDGLEFAADQWVEIVAEVAGTESSQQLKIKNVVCSSGAESRFFLEFHEEVDSELRVTGARLRRVTTYHQQPDYPDAAEPDPPAPDETDTYLAYLDVWKRDITRVEDPEILEPALDGVDTATRSKTVWQVKLEPLDPNGSHKCADYGCDWLRDRFACTGKLAAQAEQPTGAEGPCIVPKTAGYRGPENQLYRVEIHEGNCDNGDTPTFKWSRENASVVAEWKDQDGVNLIVDSAGRDKVLGFKNDDWVELTDDTRELRRKRGVIVQLADVKDNILEIDPDTIDDPDDDEATAVNIGVFPRNPKIRRWDSEGTIAVNDDWQDLEDGVQVKFELPATYRTGDYWLIPARTVDGEVLWPFYKHDTTREPLFLAPHGIQHHYCPLAIVNRDEAVFEVLKDCRKKFLPLTKSANCFHTVGPGGRFRTLERAFSSLADSDSICICLLPGDHDIEDDDVELTGLKNIKIVGCGAASTIHLSGNLDLSADQILFQDVSIRATDPKGQVSLTADTVSATGCTFQRKWVYSDAPPLVRVVALSGTLNVNLHWVNNRMSVAEDWISQSAMWDLLMPPSEPDLADVSDAMNELAAIDPAENPEGFDQQFNNTVQAIDGLDEAGLSMWFDAFEVIRMEPGFAMRPRIQKKAVETFYNGLVAAEPTTEEVSESLFVVFQAFNYGEALALAKGVEGCISCNYINGYVSLHHSEDCPPPGIYGAPEVPGEPEAPPESVKSDGATLTAQGNVFYAVRDCEFSASPAIGCKLLTVANNTFVSGDNSFVSQSVGMNGNLFPRATVEGGAVVARVRGRRGTFVGNMAPEPLNVGDPESTIEATIPENQFAEFANLITVNRL
jgi:hypothetical protein